MRLTLVSLALLILLAGPMPAAAGPPVAAEAGPVLVPDRLFDSSEVLRQAQAQSMPDLDGRTSGKNTKKAMLYSLILPGLGEYYLGHRTRAKGFFVAEGAIWTAFTVFRVQGNHRRDLYREYAEVNAGVPRRNDDDYYRVIGNYDSAEGPYSANEQVRREARAIFPNQPDRQEEYFQEHAYLGDDAWQWGSTESRLRFKDMRSSSLDAYHRADLSIGLAVANRILSVLDAGILAAKQHREEDSEGRFSWDVETGREGPGAHITLARTF